MAYNCSTWRIRVDPQGIDDFKSLFNQIKPKSRDYQAKKNEKISKLATTIVNENYENKLTI